VQQQALTLLRNVTVVNDPKDLDRIFTGFGQNLLPSLVERLNEDNDAIAEEVRLQTRWLELRLDGEMIWPCTALWALPVAQTLYIAANLASGTEVHKRTLIHCTPLLLAVRKYLVRCCRPAILTCVTCDSRESCLSVSLATNQYQSHPQPSLRVAALWVIINLSWGSDRGMPHFSRIVLLAGTS